MQGLTNVVKNLLILNVLMYILFQAIQIINPLALCLYYPTSEYFQPYQLISHMFMHANISHLAMNMIGLYFFGPPLEHLWGGKRFLFFYLFAGFGAFLLHLLVRYIELNHGGLPPGAINQPMLGASGAVFGILMGFGMKFPNQRVMLLFPPIPMKAWVFVLLYAGLELFLGFGRFQTGVAHFAHIGGALFGLLLIIYWNKFGTRYRR